MKKVHSRTISDDDEDEEDDGVETSSVATGMTAASTIPEATASPAVIAMFKNYSITNYGMFPKDEKNRYTLNYECFFHEFYDGPGSVGGRRRLVFHRDPKAPGTDLRVYLVGLQSWTNLGDTAVALRFTQEGEKVVDTLAPRMLQENTGTDGIPENFVMLPRSSHSRCHEMLFKPVQRALSDPLKGFRFESKDAERGYEKDGDQYTMPVDLDSNDQPICPVGFVWLKHNESKPPKTGKYKIMIDKRRVEVNAFTASAALFKEAKDKFLEYTGDRSLKIDTGKWYIEAVNLSKRSGPVTFHVAVKLDVYYL